MADATTLTLDWKVYVALIIASVLQGFGQVIGKELWDKFKHHQKRIKRKMNGRAR